MAIKISLKFEAYQTVLILSKNLGEINPCGKAECGGQSWSRGSFLGQS